MDTGAPVDSITTEVKVFLSYQRADTLLLAHALCYAIRAAGHTAFIDTGSIGEGEAFHDVIRNELATTNLTMCLIGPDFDVQRLHAAGNVVSFEWRRSLFHGCGIIPVLLDGADMPDDHSLPKNLNWFRERNAARLNSPNLSRDIDALIAAIPSWSATPRPAARVLWVDDKPSNNESPRRVLRQHGIIFDNAVSTQEAEFAIENAEYQLIISDLGRMGSSDRSNDAGWMLLNHPSISRGGPPVVIYTSARAANRNRPTLITRPQVVEVTANPRILVDSVLTVLGRSNPAPPDPRSR